MTLSRNTLIVLLVIAGAAIAALAWKVYEDNRQPRGVEIQVGPKGLSIEKK